MGQLPRKPFLCQNQYMDNPFEIIIEKLNRIESLVLSKSKIESNHDTNLEQVNEIINTDEAARFLSVAKQTLYGMTSRREIPHFKKGKKLYFKRAELVEWITKHPVKTKDEIDRMATEYILRNPRK